MKRKSAWIFMAAVALSAIFPAYAAAAEFASIASTADGKGWGWAVRSSQKEADKTALDGCNRSDTEKKGCSNKVAKAVVKMESANRQGMGFSEISVADAKRIAMDKCGEPACKVTEVHIKPGFIAVARTTKQDSPGHLYTAWGFTNSDSADESAREGCQKNAGEPCKIVYTSAIPGPIPAPVVEKRAGPKPVTTTNPASCRPTTASVTCQSQCANGNCVVEYANGCKIRVQITPNFNPFNNSWEYPSPSC